MKETAANLDTPQFWQFETDMLQHNPASPSIAAWCKRYVMAYRHVAHQPAPARVNGCVKIWSSSNRVLSVAELGGPQHDEAGTRARCPQLHRSQWLPHGHHTL
jgi:hypothetical protein